MKKATFEQISKGRDEVLKEGYNATDAVFPYPDDGILILGDHKIKCVKNQHNTGCTIFGMKIWIDETIKGNYFYILDKSKMEMIQ